MAALTLSEKATMANSPSFHNRLAVELMVKANYWKDFVVSTVGNYNAEVQKRKRFSKYLLNGGRPDMRSFADFLLMQYNESSPDLVTINEISQLSDAHLDSHMDTSYDWFAGVRPGDDTELIEW